MTLEVDLVLEGKFVTADEPPGTSLQSNR